LDYVLTLSAPIEKAQVLQLGSDEAPPVVEAAAVVMRQMDDLHSELVLDESTANASRLPGALRLQTTARQALTLAVTDFWQRWPKGIVAAGSRVNIELLPVQ